MCGLDPCRPRSCRCPRARRGINISKVLHGCCRETHQATPKSRVRVRNTEPNAPTCMHKHTEPLLTCCVCWANSIIQHCNVPRKKKEKKSVQKDDECFPCPHAISPVILCVISLPVPTLRMQESDDCVIKHAIHLISYTCPSHNCIVLDSLSRHALFFKSKTKSRVLTYSLLFTVERRRGDGGDV